MLDVNGTWTRSQIEACEADHLQTAASRWSSTAEQWEDHFSTIHRGMVSPGGTKWEGEGADAARDRSFSDLVRVRGMADRLYSASSIARDGADELSWAKRQALDAIAEAEEAGFDVGEDLSVTDRSLSSSLLRVSAARQVQAEALVAEIFSRAKTLTTVDKTVAAKLTSALAPLANTSAVQAVGYGFKTDIPGEEDGPEVESPTNTGHGGKDPHTGAEVLPGEGAGGGGMRPDLQHRIDLGNDPDTGKFRANEADTGLRIERELGVRLTRAPKDSGYDWNDGYGTSYDAVGPFPSKFFDKQWPQFQRQIVEHIDFKAQIVPVDVSQFTPDQQAIVRNFVNRLNNPRIVIVGGTS